MIGPQRATPASPARLRAMHKQRLAGNSPEGTKPGWDVIDDSTSQLSSRGRKTWMDATRADRLRET